METVIASERGGYYCNPVITTRYDKEDDVIAVLVRNIIKCQIPFKSRCVTLLKEGRKCFV